MPTLPPSAPDPRLTALADRVAIGDLITHYARLLDERRIEEYAALFTVDGEWIGNLGRARGRDAIVALMQRALEPVDDPSLANYHLVFNPEVAVDGDSATARSHFAFVARDAGDRPDVRMVGHYEDVLTRTPDGWRFARRQAFVDIPWKRTPR